ncbi:GNAT family N-acetyltransferase [Lacisediminimonas sp.]|uniref:GNAT family N-acetyltransferase n=1 Tax=Lacisediminimonas sp. TaxID=3060582 RepID=UPI00271A3E25|nr:GNAT family N-acetyltransferase [Lacisediminimonas sp.]MDO8298327.1 GNAT family N-acetyltransferase [Lacisediminimonas sp.]
MDLLVREAAADDAHLIAGLTRACWPSQGAPGPDGQDDPAAVVTQHLQQGGGFILQDGQQAIGSVRWLPLEAEEGVWEIRLMGVLPQWRGNHLSQHLLEAVIHHAHASNVDELRLAVPADQPRLVDLYAAQGFELAMELDVEHADPLEPAPNVMRRMLRR